MSTINPSTIDPTKPETGEATTASVRANEQATQNNFTAAKNDIEALEAHPPRTDNPHGVTAAQAGADPAGSAAAVQGNLDTHEGDVSIHRVAIHKVQKDGAGVSTDRAAIDFRATGDASVSVVDDGANDRTIITIDATAGSGGGGVGKGTRFVPTEIAYAESDAGDGTVATISGLTASGLSSHIADSSIHFTEASIDHTAIQNVGTNTHAQIDSHIAASGIHFTEASIDHGSIAGLADDDHPQYHTDIRGDARYYPRTEADSVFLKSVVDDATPELGGDLDMAGNGLLIKDSANTIIKGVLTTVNADADIALVYSRDGVVYDPADGALALGSGKAHLYGTAAVFEGLTHSLDGGRQVYVSEDGTLFGVDPPPVSWSENDTDTGDYDLGSGLGTGAWTEITGLVITTPEDIEAGQRVNFNVNLYIAEIGGRSGDVSYGFGLGVGVAPTAPFGTASISADFEGFVPMSGSTLADGAWPAGTVFSIWARRENGSHSQYDPNVSGTLAPDTHEVVVSTPGSSSGGGGSGDVVGPGTSVVGNVVTWNNTTGTLVADSGIAAADVGSKRRYDTRTWALPGEQTARTLAGAFVLWDDNNNYSESRILKWRAKIGGGTSINIQCLVNGAPAGAVVTIITTAQTHVIDQAISEDDHITFILSTPVGTPTDLEISLLLRHTE